MTDPPLPCTTLVRSRDRAFLAQMAAVLAVCVAHFGHGADSVVGHAVDDDGSAADAVAFVADLFVIGAVGPASAALNGTLDVFLGHVGCGTLVPSHAQAWVGIGVGADRKRTRLNSSH